MISSFSHLWTKLRRRRDDTRRDRRVLIDGVSVAVGRCTYGVGHVSILSWNGPDVRVSIGRFCSISFGVKIFTGGNHRVDWITTYPFGHLRPTSLHMEPVAGHPAPPQPVTIGHDVWIGRDVTIMSGVAIGNGAVIAANSHVVSAVPAYAIYGGNPARLIRYRFDDRTIARLMTMAWWDWPLEKVMASVDTLCAPPTTPSVHD